MIFLTKVIGNNPRLKFEFTLYPVSCPRWFSYLGTKFKTMAFNYKCQKQIIFF